MAPSLSLIVTQDILDGRDCSARLPTIRIPEESLEDSDLLSVFDHPRPLGISPGYSESGKLVSLSFADNDKCRIIEFQHPNKRDNRRPATDKAVVPPAIIEGRKLIQDKILCRPMGDIFAFDMGPLAMSLYCDLGMRITSAVDIQSAFSAVARKPISAIEDALGKEFDSVTSSKIKIKADNVKSLFLYPVYDSSDRNTVVDLAVRAWVSQFLPGYGNGEQLFEKVPRIDTNKLGAQVRSIVGFS
ncbi:hypothetical protein GALMADRAFT_1275033 [Galerina marginata CBS 339.88]|uniref:Uncharacterized protein n=1 Tax=Galerina marginata (strain CBS 339.88) TaxID=685588 RepID=A0A067TIS9_GALM3|nr:hypothetical protein GALMADRAFT_1275033 [Galerina marginata CBS 339.88]